MLDRNQIISHFTGSAERYMWTPPDETDFCIRSFDGIGGKSLRVLDMGCGTGERLEALSRFYPALCLFGLDLTPAMMKKAKERKIFGNPFLLADCLKAPFRSGSMDAVILGDVLHHLIAGTQRDSCVLRKMAWDEALRIVRPGGMVLLRESCVNTDWRSKLIFVLSRMLSRGHVSIPVLNVHPGLVVNFFSVAELEEFLSESGLDREASQNTAIEGWANWVAGLGSSVRDIWYRLRLPED